MVLVDVAGVKKNHKDLNGRIIVKVSPYNKNKVHFDLQYYDGFFEKWTRFAFGSGDIKQREVLTEKIAKKYSGFRVINLDG